MILTILFAVLLGVIAFGLTRPLDPRRLVVAAILGGGLGLLSAYFNVYPGSIRAALALLAVAFFLSAMRFGGQFVPATEPLLPRLPWVGAAIALVLVGAALFPFSAAGADSADEPIYHDLNNNIVVGPAPALPSASDVRVVPWDLAAQIVVRGYGADASYLDTNPGLLMRHTYPDTVNGEFIWVHAPTPETAKWLFGDQTADKVVFVRNNATNLEPDVVTGTLNIHVDGRFWQDRVERYAIHNAEFRYKVQDVALQLDEDRVPHWIAYLTRIDIRDQPHLEKLIIINAYTGEEQIVTPGEVPDWVEMVYPESYVYYWAQYWGQFREGIMYRWFDANRLMQPDDVTVRYIRLENATYWLLPMRQLNAPQLGGYILVNTRTGDATFYDRFESRLVDYTTASNQLQAIMASGEATGGQGQIRLSISEGYLYPIAMNDGSIRDAYVFPLLEGLRVRNFAIIDAQHYQERRVFAPTMQAALDLFANQTTSRTVVPEVPGVEPGVPVDLPVIDGVIVSEDRVLVNLNGTHYRVTSEQLAGGQRLDPANEMDELTFAVARANRGESVTLRVVIEGGAIVDVTYPGIAWGA